MAIAVPKEGLNADCEGIAPPAKRQEGATEQVEYGTTDSKNKITRRALFALLGGISAAGALGATAASEKGDAVEIEKGWRPEDAGMQGHSKFVHGNTVGIKNANGMHTMLNNIHYGRKNPDFLPDSADAVVLEMLSTRWAGNDAKPKKCLHGFYQDEMNRSVLDEAQKRGIPVMLTTPYLQDSKSRDIKLKAEAAEFLAGATLAILGCKEIGKNKKVNRRAFIGSAAIATGAYASLPFASSVARVASVQAGVGNRATSAAHRFARDVNPWVEKHFPESALLALIMIHKNEWLMKEGVCRNPAMVIGGEHTEMEWAATLSDEERLKILLKNSKALSESIEYESVYAIQEMVPSETSSSVFNEGRRWEVPELKDIMKYLVHGSSGMCSTPELRSAYAWYKRNYPSSNI